MKNLSIRTKLVTGFLLIAIIAAAVGGVGTVGLVTLSNNETDLYEDTVKSLLYATQLRASFNEQRVDMYALANAASSPEDRELTIEKMAADEQAFEENLELYKSLMLDADEEEEVLVAEIESIYTGSFSADKERMMVFAGAGLVSSMNAEVKRSQKDSMGEIVALISQLVEHNATKADDIQAKDTSFANLMIIVSLSISVAAMVLAVWLGLYLSRLIATPARKVVTAAEALAVGDITVDIDVYSRDEMGMLADAFRNMCAAIRQQADVLAQISEGNYAITIPVRSEADVMNKAICQMLETNNEVMTELRVSSQQVDGGASQIASGAQALATGSTQQAATIQQFRASIQEVEQQSDYNRKLATEVAEQMGVAGEKVSSSVGDMNRLLDAMQTINDSSQNIAKVIKVIDDIAFQTNILALNAAVEAARAGQHGKGFAVVADEVRNLASKSAAAAKETADLIEHSVQNVQQGNQYVQQTNQSLDEVKELTVATSESINNMYISTEQAGLAIQEITQGISQLSDVVQANSATAEESAASAEEMSAQASLLNKIVSRFRLTADAVEDAPAEGEQSMDFQQLAPAEDVPMLEQGEEVV